MGRVAFLALLALALSTASLASSIGINNYQNFGTVKAGMVSTQRALGWITVTRGSLAGGTVMIAGTGGRLFLGSFNNDFSFGMERNRAISGDTISTPEPGTLGLLGTGLLGLAGIIRRKVRS